MAIPVLNYATRTPPRRFMRFGLCIAAAVVGLFCSYAGLVAAGHGGPFWPVAAAGGPWLGPICLFTHLASLPPTFILPAYFVAGAFGFAGYMYLFLGPLSRFGYLRAAILLAVIHSLGAAFSLGLTFLLA